jgi:hypothetical protein
MLPLTWPNGERIVESRLLIIAANDDFSVKASADFTFDSDAGFKPYTNDEGGFALRLPQGWTASRSRQALFGSVYLLGPAPLVEGDLGNSFIIIADLEEVTLEQAIDRLCGSCAQAPETQQVLINGWVATRASIGSEGWPTLEWTFVEHDGKLIALAIHDPVTLKPLQEVVDTLMFVPSMQQSA